MYVCEIAKGEEENKMEEKYSSIGERMSLQHMGKGNAGRNN